MAPPTRPTGIGTLHEGPLHAALKERIEEPGDRFEVEVDGRLIDVVRGDLLIEIQTGSLSPLRAKLDALLPSHTVRVVHPVPIEKWVTRVKGPERVVLGRRKSPKRGSVFDAVEHIVGIAHLLAHPRLSVELLLTQEEEVRRLEVGRVWRRKGWVIVERRLVGLLERRRLDGPAAWRALLPAGLPDRFSTADLASGLSVGRAVAQQLAYCLRGASVIRVDGKVGNARLYRLIDEACARVSVG